MQERSDAGQEGCRTGGMQERRVTRKGGMQVGEGVGSGEKEFGERVGRDERERVETGEWRVGGG